MEINQEEQIMQIRLSQKIQIIFPESCFKLFNFFFVFNSKFKFFKMKTYRVTKNNTE